MRIGIGAKLHPIPAAALVGIVTASGIGASARRRRSSRTAWPRPATTRNDPQPRGHGLRVAAALEEQNAAIREIVRGVSSAATGAQGVTGNVGGLRQGADQTVRAFLTEVKAA